MGVCQNMQGFRNITQDYHSGIADQLVQLRVLTFDRGCETPYFSKRSKILNVRPQGPLSGTRVIGRLQNTGGLARRAAMKPAQATVEATVRT
ncbi:hypothetical protein SAMN05660971_02870 [Halomonas cupida]|uniref:Uncharacterized protein n=1 Tax=Halomonas cupida TaxID=44933 RepID=A0A1M7I9P2_9GAMM|nr:hypothetical protein SAMN05660971_02870 [Halomonas cupida]